MTIIDAHLHVWDTDRLDYAWLRDEPRIGRPLGFAEFAAERKPSAAHVDGFVFVQADCRADQAIAEVLDWSAPLSEDERATLLSSTAVRTYGPDTP